MIPSWFRHACRTSGSYAHRPPTRSVNLVEPLVSAENLTKHYWEVDRRPELVLRYARMRYRTTSTMCSSRGDFPADRTIFGLFPTIGNLSRRSL